MLLTQLVQVLFLFSYAAATHTAASINFAIDHREHLIPHTKYNYSHFVNVHTLKVVEDIAHPFDLVTHADFDVLNGLFVKANQTFPSYLSHNAYARNLFESKSNWKAWMSSIGLGDHVPTTYTTNRLDLIKYPVIIKTNEHNGKGVYIAADVQDFHRLISVISKKKAAYATNYTIEEALTGMGLSEAVSFGSVLNGKLLSLRCAVRFFDPEKAALSATHGHDKYHLDMDAVKNSSLFIRGKNLLPDRQAYIPCSKELVNLTQTMFAHLPPYTGGFCSNIKTDSLGRFKLLETNARFCYSMRTVEEIFLSTYVPLSFAVQEQLPVHARAAWVNLSHLVHFYRQEQDVLRTGGGISGGTLISVEKFDPSLRVDGPVYQQDSTWAAV